ncbi:hypothetical protein [Nostoc sp.]|uniref:hypothetical protein n=1 Tax=Nostoc sp. TaxID=1180 RepID=UPI002FFA5E8B
MDNALPISSIIPQPNKFGHSLISPGLFAGALRFTSRNLIGRRSLLSQRQMFWLSLNSIGLFRIALEY